MRKLVSHAVLSVAVHWKRWAFLVVRLYRLCTHLGTSSWPHRFDLHVGASVICLRNVGEAHILDDSDAEHMLRCAMAVLAASSCLSSVRDALVAGGAATSLVLMMDLGWSPCPGYALCSLKSASVMQSICWYSVLCKISVCKSDQPDANINTWWQAQVVLPLKPAI